MDQRSWLSQSDPVFSIHEGLNFEESMENQLVDLSENPSQQMSSDGPSSPSQNSVENSAGNILPNRTELNRNLVLPRASLQETPPSTGHWCKPPLQNTLGSKLNRLSSTNGRRSADLSSAAKNPMFSTNEIAETFDAYHKENFNLKLKIADLEDKLEKALADNSMLDDGDFVKTNRSLEEKMKVLRNEMRQWQEDQSRKLDEAYSEGYAKASADRQPDGSTSQSSAAVGSERSFDGKKPHGSPSPSTDSNSTFREWADHVNKTPNSLISSPFSLSIGHLEMEKNLTVRLEEARRQGYDEALQNLQKNEENLPKPAVFDRSSSPRSPAPETLTTKAQNQPKGPGGNTNNTDLTEYRDFPSSAARTGASSVMSPFKKTRLAAGGDGGRSLGNGSPVPTVTTSTPFARFQKMTGLERKTFSMLIQRLTELVQFLENGLNCSFNASDTSLNVSQTFFKSNLDISLIPDFGSGDGSHVSFSLATKLQELIDISREFSLHDAEVETDEHWKSLQEEKATLSEQVDALNQALAAANEAAAASERQCVVLTDRVSESEADADGLKVALQSANEAKTILQQQLSEMIDSITRLEQQMDQQKESQRAIMELFVPRPECHASSCTEVLMTEMDAELASFQHEREELVEKISFLQSQLGTVEASKQHLETRLDQLGSLLTQWEACDAERQTLQTRLEETIGESRDLRAELATTKGMLAMENAQMEALQTQKHSLESQLIALKDSREVQVAETEQKITRLEAEIIDLMLSRQAVQDDLHAASDSVRFLQDQLHDVIQALEKEQKSCQNLESLLNKERRHVSLETDICWSTLRSEKAEMTSTISRLVDQMEVMEADLIAARQSSERQLHAKEDERDQLTELITRFTDETERLDATNRKLKEELTLLKAKLVETETKLGEEKEKRAIWNKKVSKEIGKTQKVINEASQNIQGFTRGTAAGPLNPLTDNRKQM